MTRFAELAAPLDRLSSVNDRVLVLASAAAVAASPVAPEILRVTLCLAAAVIMPGWALLVRLGQVGERDGWSVTLTKSAVMSIVVWIVVLVLFGAIGLPLTGGRPAWITAALLLILAVVPGGSHSVDVRPEWSHLRPVLAAAVAGALVTIGIAFTKQHQPSTGVSLGVVGSGQPDDWARAGHVAVSVGFDGSGQIFVRLVARLDGRMIASRDLTAVAGTRQVVSMPLTNVLCGGHLTIETQDADGSPEGRPLTSTLAHRGGCT